MRLRAFGKVTVSLVALSSLVIGVPASGASAATVRAETISDEAFYSQLVKKAPDLAPGGASEIASTARTICEGLQAGIPVGDIFSIVRDQYSFETTVVFLRESVASFCKGESRAVNRELKAREKKQEGKSKKASRCDDLWGSFVAAFSYQNPRKTDQALKKLATQVKDSTTRKQIDEIRIDAQDGSYSRALFESTAGRLRLGWC